MPKTDYLDDPSAPRPNSLVVGVTAFVQDDAGRVLLIERADNGQWALPGGGQEVGESTPAAAVRETLEETGHTIALDAFLGSLPGHGHPNLRRALIPSRSVVCTLPLTSVWPGLAENPSPYFPAHSPPLLWARTDGSTPFRVNLHVSDVGHTLVVGATGAGKSVLLTTAAAQWLRYPGAQVFYFDVGGSAWPLAQAAGARHYELAAGRPDALAFQPLARVDDPAGGRDGARDVGPGHGLGEVVGRRRR